MAAAIGNDIDLLTRAIKAGVQHEVNRIAEEEIIEAQSRIEARVRQQMDKIALNLLGEYMLERMGPNIVITVRKQL